MNLTYKYALRTTKKQEYLLDEVLFQMQTVYNDALNERRWYWSRSRRSITYYDQWARFRDLRHDVPDELNMLNATSIQQMLRRVDQSYRAFYKGIRGFPRFKGRNRFKSVTYRHGNGSKLTGDRLYIQHVGKIKVRLHRPIPENAKIKQVIIKRKDGKWYAYFQLELPDIAIAQHTGDVVGIDVGIKSLLALSNGELIDNPRWFRQERRKLRVAQRRVNRRKRGSKRRRKAAMQVAKIQDHIANRRRDFWHKLTKELADQYSVIAIEKLNLSFMLRNRHLSLSAHDAALGEFFQLLRYKAECAGSELIEVNPHNTSQECSGCGAIVPKGLSVRTHRCHCGIELDRDVNAARVILNRAVGQTVKASTWSGTTCVALEAPSL